MANQTADFLTVEELVNQIIQNSINTSAGLEAFSDDDNSSTHIVNLINYFPPDFMNNHIRRNGGIVIHFILFSYLFLVTIVLIESYFIKSIEYICSVYRISPCVAGSTIMALGTSTSELVTSLINVSSGGNSSILTEVVIGTATFNMLAIPALCGLGVFFFKDGQSVVITQWAVIRDLLFYAITTILFSLSIKDNSVDWSEALIFTFIYGVYMFFLYIWSNFIIITRRLPKRMIKNHSTYFSGYQTKLESNTTRTVEIDETQTDQAMSMIKDVNSKNLFENNDFIQSLLWPCLFAMRMTMPKPKSSSFMATFLLSIVWMTLLAYLQMWLMDIISSTLNIGERMHMMTLHGFTSNIPELISSYVVIHKFRMVDMALCNAIGSNIFDILICLGLPWFLNILASIIFKGSPLSELAQYEIDLESGTLYFVILSLIYSIAIFVIILAANKWRLNLRTGLCFTVAYIALLGFSFYII